MFNRAQYILLIFLAVVGLGATGCATSTPPPTLPPAVPVPVTGTPVATVFVVPSTLTPAQPPDVPTQADPAATPGDTFSLPQDCYRETVTSPETRLSEINLDGESGKVIDPVNGRPNARSILVLHGGNLYILSFAPTLKDTPASQHNDVWKNGQKDMETLYEVVTSSFAFLPSTTAEQPMPMLTEISWQTAQEMILNGQVTSVSQSHSLQVNLTLTDGRVLHTVEPQIDEIMRVINQCGERCRAIVVATE